MNTIQQIKNTLEKEGVVAIKETLTNKQLETIKNIIQKEKKRKETIPNKYSYTEIHIPKKLLEEEGIRTLLLIIQRIQTQGTKVNIHLQEYNKGDYTLIYEDKEKTPLLRAIYCIEGTGTEKTGGRRIYLNAYGKPTPIEIEPNTLILSNNTHIEYHEYQQKTIKKPITILEIHIE